MKLPACRRRRRRRLSLFSQLESFRVERTALALLKLSAWSYLLLENETDSNYGLMTLLSWRKVINLLIK
jgi:hypothetical protein